MALQNRHIEQLKMAYWRAQ